MISEHVIVQVRVTFVVLVFRASILTAQVSYPPLPHYRTAIALGSALSQFVVNSTTAMREAHHTERAARPVLVREALCALYLGVSNNVISALGSGARSSPA